MTPPPPRWLPILAAVIVLQGLAFLLLALPMPIGGAVGASLDPDFDGLPHRWAIGAGMGLLAMLWLLAFAAFYLAAGIGLSRRRRWGWFMALVASAGWITTCCAPLGFVAVWLLARPEVRATCGIDARC